MKDIPLPPKDTRRTKNVYNSLSEMEMKIGKQKLSGYQLESQEKKIILKKMKLPYTLPYVEITVDESLEFTCSILGWIVPDIHTLYRTFRRSARRRTIAELIDFVNNFMHWNVNTVVSYWWFASSYCTLQTIWRVWWPLRTSKVFMRTINCQVLINCKSDICQQCARFEANLEKKATLEKKKNKAVESKVKLALQNEKLERK